MKPAGFEPAIPASERLQTHAVDGVATWLASLNITGSPGIESRWRRDIPRPSRTALGPTQPSCTMGTGAFLRIKRPGRDFDHPTPRSAEVKERVEL